ncbi:MAG: serine hydrolase [Cyclobacteriaceae bacterium]|nr:serine hydrolase [Cyclobacteriaceae bacterium]
MLVQRLIIAMLFLIKSISSTAQSDEKRNELQMILDKTVDGKKVFGASFAIKKDTFIWQGASGNLSIDQSYFIASTTKLFTTAIILKLRAEGKLSLDDKISSYIDKSILSGLHIYKGKEYSYELTIKHLLAHTSGLPDYFQGKGTSGKSLENEITAGNDQFWTFEQAIERTKKMSPLFAPGTKGKANYSDANFQLLGKIIENITHKSYVENCKEFIIQPLGLTKTYLYQDTTDKTPKTLYYKNKELNIPKAMTSFGADGGIVSTSSDMLIFIEAFFTGELFPKQYINELKEWNKIFSPLQSGVGIHLFKLPKFLGMPVLIGHSGLSGALAYYDPKNEIYVAGTVNQIAYPSKSFSLTTKLIQTLLIRKKKRKIETVSAIGLGAIYSNLENNSGTPKIGLTLELNKEYKIIKPISFTTGINYAQRGETSQSDIANIRLHYLDLPLMFKLNTFKSKIGISSGISTNILLGSNKEKNTFQRVEYSLPFAINYGISDFMQLSFKYNIGITDITKNYYTNQGLRNNWFGISLLLVKP